MTRNRLKLECFGAQLVFFLVLNCVFPVLAYGESRLTPSTTDKPVLEKVHLQLKWFHQYQFAGYYAAIAQGYYAEEGLDVELIERDLNKSVIDQVVTGAAEYGVGDSGLLHDYSIGKPVVALAAIFQHNPLVFMTLRDSGIISPFEMKDKRIMLDTLSANEAPLKALLAYSNISANDFTIIKQSADNSLLTRGELDVMSGYLSDAPYYYQQHNFPINIINPQNYGIDFYGDILFTSDNERQQHPERIERFLRASLKGWRYALDHPDALIQLISTQYHSKLSLAHLQFEASQIKKLIPDTIPLGYIDLERMGVLADLYVKAGYNQAIEKIKLKNFVYHSVLPHLNLSEAEKQWLAEHPVIRVGVNPNKQPYEWVDEHGQYVGMGADYLKLIEQRLGIHFTIVIPKNGFYENIESLNKGEIDMLAGVVITSERSKTLSFINPYLNSPTVIVNNDRQPFNSLEKLKGKVLAVEKASAIEEWIKRDYPDIKLLEVNDPPSGLRWVDTGKAVAYLGDIATSNYWLKKKDLSNLVISGQTEYRSDLAIGISKQRPELYAIIYKASLTIDPQQVDDIVNHYLSLQIDEGFNKTLVKRYLFFAVIILFLVTLLWVWRLRKEIAARQYEIELRQHLEQREYRRNAVLDMLTSHQPMSDILQTLCVDVEQMDSEIACSILLLSDDGKYLNHCVAPSLPAFYNSAIDGLEIGPEVGSCGTAVYQGQSVFVEDIKNHPSWITYRAFTQKIPYRACWSQPIKSSLGEILGTFAIYHRTPQMPSSRVVDLINDCAKLAGIIIERSKLNVQTQLAANVYNHTKEGIYITDKNNNIIDCNNAFLAFSGYSREELLGKNPRLFKSGVHAPAFYANMWQTLLSEGFWSGEIWNKYKGRSELSPALHSVTVIRNEKNEIERFMAITSDISELKRHQQQLEQYAYNDNLTGLPNRLLLTDRLDQQILYSNREHRNLAVVFIDLDGFKEINDYYGHEVGDEYLIAVSQAMRSVVRESDTLGRLGGDEFIVIIYNLEHLSSIHIPINHLLEAINSPIMIRNVTLKTTASMGVTYYEGQPNRHIDANALIRQADLAMYAAKQAGKNCYHVFDDKTDQINNTREEFIKHIQVGIQESEFVLHYQPKVNMRTGELLGVEALIRWNHPHNGLLQPNQFLSIIENHPVSVELGNWVITQALSQLNQWQALGLSIPVSINVDAKHLNQINFIDNLTAEIAQYPHYQPGSLEIEILESSAFTNPEQASLVMSECQHLGVEFSLDDFGTGYSSLAYLKALPINTIKIDRSFVSNVLFNTDDLAIVESIISLGNVMGRIVIAEGVESFAVGEVLLKHGCDYAQGYGIAKPMPADELLAWKAQWQPDAAWVNAL